LGGNKKIEKIFKKLENHLQVYYNKFNNQLNKYSKGDDFYGINFTTVNGKFKGNS